MSVHMSAVRQIAALGLNERPPISIETSQADAVLHALRLDRLEGVAVSGLANGEIEADDAFAASVVNQHDETMAQTLAIEVASISVSELLDNAGVVHRLLKGPAIAHSVARNPSERPFRDVDVLVPGSRIDTAIAALTQAGAIRLQPQLRRDFDARFAKSVTMSLHDVEIDLHRTLCAGPFGVWMHPDDLFLLVANLELGGTNLPTLDPTDHLVHACYHAALGSATPALLSLRDIALLATSDWDAERFGQTIERWRGRAVVRRAVELVEYELDVELPQSLSRFANEQVEAKEAAAIDPYLTTSKSGRFAALAPATLRALPLRDRAAFARAVGLPEGTEVKDRVRGLLARER